MSNALGLPRLRVRRRFRPPQPWAIYWVVMMGNALLFVLRHLLRPEGFSLFLAVAWSVLFVGYRAGYRRSKRRAERTDAMLPPPRRRDWMFVALVTLIQVLGWLQLFGVTA